MKNDVTYLVLGHSSRILCSQEICSQFAVWYLTRSSERHNFVTTYVFYYRANTYSLYRRYVLRAHVNILFIV